PLNNGELKRGIFADWLAVELIGEGVEEIHKAVIEAYKKGEDREFLTKGGLVRINLTAGRKGSLTIAPEAESVIKQCYDTAQEEGLSLGEYKKFRQMVEDQLTAQLLRKSDDQYAFEEVDGQIESKCIEPATGARTNQREQRIQTAIEIKEYRAGNFKGEILGESQTNNSLTIHSIIERAAKSGGLVAGMSGTFGEVVKDELVRTAGKDPALIGIEVPNHYESVVIDEGFISGDTDSSTMESIINWITRMKNDRKGAPMMMALNSDNTAQWIIEQIETAVNQKRFAYGNIKVIGPETTVKKMEEMESNRSADTLFIYKVTAATTDSQIEHIRIYGGQPDTFLIGGKTIGRGFDAGFKTINVEEIGQQIKTMLSEVGIPEEKAEGIILLMEEMLSDLRAERNMDIRKEKIKNIQTYFSTVRNLLREGGVSREVLADFETMERRIFAREVYGFQEVYQVDDVTIGEGKQREGRVARQSDAGSVCKLVCYQKGESKFADMIDFERGIEARLGGIREMIPVFKSLVAGKISLKEAFIQFAQTSLVDRLKGLVLGENSGEAAFRKMNSLIEQNIQLTQDQGEIIEKIKASVKEEEKSELEQQLEDINGKMAGINKKAIALKIYAVDRLERSDSRYRLATRNRGLFATRVYEKIENSRKNILKAEVTELNIIQRIIQGLRIRQFFSQEALAGLFIKEEIKNYRKMAKEAEDPVQRTEYYQQMISRLEKGLNIELAGLTEEALLYKKLKTNKLVNLITQQVIEQRGEENIFYVNEQTNTGVLDDAFNSVKAQYISYAESQQHKNMAVPLLPDLIKVQIYKLMLTYRYQRDMRRIVSRMSQTMKEGLDKTIETESLDKKNMEVDVNSVIRNVSAGMTDALKISELMAGKRERSLKTRVGKGIDNAVNLFADFMWRARGRLLGEIKERVVTVAGKREMAAGIPMVMGQAGKSHTEMKVAKYIEVNTEERERKGKWMKENKVTLDLKAELEAEGVFVTTKVTEEVAEVAEEKLVEVKKPAEVVTEVPGEVPDEAVPFDTKIIAHFQGETEQINKDLENIQTAIEGLDIEVETEEVNQVYQQLSEIRTKISSLRREYKTMEVPEDLSKELQASLEKVGTVINTLDNRAIKLNNELDEKTGAHIIPSRFDIRNIIRKVDQRVLTFTQNLASSKLGKPVFVLSSGVVFAAFLFTLFNGLSFGMLPILALVFTPVTILFSFFKKESGTTSPVQPKEGVVGKVMNISEKLKAIIGGPPGKPDSWTNLFISGIALIAFGISLGFGPAVLLTAGAAASAGVSMMGFGLSPIMLFFITVPILQKTKLPDKFADKIGGLLGIRRAKIENKEALENLKLRLEENIRQNKENVPLPMKHLEEQAGIIAFGEEEIAEEKLTPAMKEQYQRVLSGLEKYWRKVERELLKEAISQSEKDISHAAEVNKAVNDAAIATFCGLRVNFERVKEKKTLLPDNKKLEELALQIAAAELEKDVSSGAVNARVEEVLPYLKEYWFAAEEKVLTDKIAQAKADLSNIVKIAEEERGELIASNAVQLAWAEENAQALELMQQRLEENRKISQLTPRQLAKRQKAMWANVAVKLGYQPGEKLYLQINKTLQQYWVTVEKELLQTAIKESQEDITRASALNKAVNDVAIAALCGMKTKLEKSRQKEILPSAEQLQKLAVDIVNAEVKKDISDEARNARIAEVLQYLKMYWFEAEQKVLTERIAQAKGDLANIVYIAKAPQEEVIAQYAGQLAPERLKEKREKLAVHIEQELAEWSVQTQPAVILESQKQLIALINKAEYLTDETKETHINAINQKVAELEQARTIQPEEAVEVEKVVTPPEVEAKPVEEGVSFARIIGDVFARTLRPFQALHWGIEEEVDAIIAGLGLKQRKVRLTLKQKQKVINALNLLEDEFTELEDKELSVAIQKALDELINNPEKLKVIEGKWFTMDESNTLKAWVGAFLDGPDVFILKAMIKGVSEKQLAGAILHEVLEVQGVGHEQAKEIVDTFVAGEEAIEERMEKIAMLEAAGFKTTNQRILKLGIEEIKERITFLNELKESGVKVSVGWLTYAPAVLKERVEALIEMGITYAQITPELIIIQGYIQRLAKGEDVEKQLNDKIAKLSQQPENKEIVSKLMTRIDEIKEMVVPEEEIVEVAKPKELKEVEVTKPATEVKPPVKEVAKPPVEKGVEARPEGIFTKVKKLFIGLYKGIIKEKKVSSEFERLFSKGLPHIEKAFVDFNKALALADKKAGIGPRELYESQKEGAFLLAELEQFVKQKTSGGKTLMLIAAAYLRVFKDRGKNEGVLISTSEDTLAERDALEAGRILSLLNVIVGLVKSGKDGQPQGFIYNAEKDSFEEVSEKDVYQADVVYGTTDRFVHRYENDLLASDISQRVFMTKNWFTLIDEVDPPLDYNRTMPYSISGKFATESERILHYQSEAEKMVSNVFKLNPTYINVMKDKKRVKLESKGKKQLIKELEMVGILEGLTKAKKKLVIAEWKRYVEMSLTAHYCYETDKDYKLELNLKTKRMEVVIIDAESGKPVYGRRWQGGLHSALEAKEGLMIEPEALTMSTKNISKFLSLSNMVGFSGTSATIDEEVMENLYGKKTVELGGEMETLRKEINPVNLYKTQREKDEAVVTEILNSHFATGNSFASKWMEDNEPDYGYEEGMPILVKVGFTKEAEQLRGKLIAEAKRTGRKLDENNIRIMTASNYDEIDDVIEQAGKPGMITIVTPLGGRGMDIKLAEEVAEYGGMLAISTSLDEFESSLIQFQGRVGRKGAAGVWEAFYSLQDEVFLTYNELVPEGMNWLENAFRKTETGEALQKEKTTYVLTEIQKVIKKHRLWMNKQQEEYADYIDNLSVEYFGLREKVLTGVTNDAERKHMLTEMDGLLAEFLTGTESVKRDLYEALMEYDWKQQILQMDMYVEYIDNVNESYRNLMTNIEKIHGFKETGIAIEKEKFKVGYLQNLVKGIAITGAAIIGYFLYRQIFDIIGGQGLSVLSDTTVVTSVLTAFGLGQVPWLILGVVGFSTLIATLYVRNNYLNRVMMADKSVRNLRLFLKGVQEGNFLNVLSKFLSQQLLNLISYLGPMAGIIMYVAGTVLPPSLLFVSPDLLIMAATVLSIAGLAASLLVVAMNRAALKEGYPIPVTRAGRLVRSSISSLVAVTFIVFFWQVGGVVIGEIFGAGIVGLAILYANRMTSKEKSADIKMIMLGIISGGVAFIGLSYLISFYGIIAGLIPMALVMLVPFVISGILYFLAQYDLTKKLVPIKVKVEEKPAPIKKAM
ncbi:hypothetical protein KAU39_02040, partial [bacterium]|nr:hypothetical protein [bacterium]